MATADQLIDIFNEAKARLAGEERQRFVTEACKDAPELQQQVISLLQAYDASTGFLQPNPFFSPTVLGTEQHGDRIGRYKLLEQIGEGGCGIVYMAEQEDPVRRRVALKVIKLGMDTKQVIARFEAERQALALMDHPNIAKVFDGGATETGRPYFVMELVRGISITRFCDERCLPTKERLRLFVCVCQAVQHAHQKGIIHRDLKPSNILVTVNDGVAVPKVIDFGIAKATGRSLTDNTLFTHFNSFIGTPAYTSPEQAQMSSVDVDTRSDIYSLGVLLYELLTGRTPFNSDELLRSGLEEMRRTIRHKEPTQPSTFLRALGSAEATTLSGKRQTNASEWALSIRGDLDCIVMKCLEKDRSRRYETTNGLSADIERHLNSEPVTARSRSSIYLLQKFAQRNKGSLIASAAVFVLLIAAVLNLSISNLRIRHERNEKDHALEERSIALEVARNSEHQAREQLFVSLQSQAQARRSSQRMGQRMESLAVLSEAARIRSTPELRDNTIAAMALPDVQYGPMWDGWNTAMKGGGCDDFYNRYALVSDDGVISIRSIPEQRELKRLDAGPLVPGWSDWRWLTFSPDGKLLARIEGNARLGLWNWETGQSILREPPERCSMVAFSPDGRQIAVAFDESIACYNLANWQENRRWQIQGKPHAFSFNPDSRRLAVGYARSKVVSIYDSLDATLVADLPIGLSFQEVVAWHPDGELLATAGSDPRIQLWNVNTRHKVSVLEGHVEQVTLLSFHPDGKLFGSASYDGDFRLWHPVPARLLMRFPFSGSMSFGKDGAWTGVIFLGTNQAKLWKVIPSQEYHTFISSFAEGRARLREGDINPDGTLLALGASDGVGIWDVARGREIARLSMHDTTTTLFLKNGDLLTCGADGLQFWPIQAKTTTKEELQIGPPHRIPLPFEPKRISKSHDERTVAIVGYGAGEAATLDLARETLIASGMPHDQATYIALTPDGHQLATSGWRSKIVKLWDAQSGTLLKELEVGMSTLVYFTPDNRELIVSRGIECTFYDLRTLEITRQFSRDAGLYPGHVAFTADGKLLALEISPGIIDLKEATSGRTVAKLEDPSRDVCTWMNFTPDGSQLVAVARYAGVIHRWDLRAIRERLRPMGLDWDWPPFPSLSGAPLSKSSPSLRIHVLSAKPPSTEVRPASKLSASEP